MGDKVPSPCIDVCKFKRAGHCIGCSMTKVQKKRFKSIDKKKKRMRFVLELMEQQERLGKYTHWARAYEKKCKKKNVAFPAA